MLRWLLVLAACAACKKEQAAAPPPDDRPRPIPASELKRGEDACAAYVTKVCACTAPDAPRLCGLARALPDAIATALEVAQNPQADRRDVVQSNDLVRKTMRECIEQLGKLPALGCN